VLLFGGDVKREIHFGQSMMIPKHYYSSNGNCKALAKLLFTKYFTIRKLAS
jgi:hypothetical protein